MNTLTCVQCLVAFRHSMPHTKVCSEECREARYEKLYGRKGDTSIPRLTTGALAELIAAADLLRNGYAVFRSLSPSCPCDLIAMKKNGEIVRVEVRSGFRGETGSVQFPKERHGKVDLFAVYLHKQNELLYFDTKLKPTTI